MKSEVPDDMTLAPKKEKKRGKHPTKTEASDEETVASVVTDPYLA